MKAIGLDHAGTNVNQIARRIASRRAVLRLGVAGMGAAVVAACGGGDDAPTASPTSPVTTGP